MMDLGIERTLSNSLAIHWRYKMKQQEPKSGLAF
jgi:hypothetical protein